jgi:hypothetical protein
MLSVSIHKDIGEYTEKVVGKLSLRTLLCVVGGLAVSVGIAAALYFGFGINPSNATLPVMACSMPFWLAGFWRPKGLKAEEFCRLYAAHALSDGKLLYASGFLAEAPQVAEKIAAKPDRRYRRRSKRKGAEKHEPSKR